MAEPPRIILRVVKDDTLDEYFDPHTALYATLKVANYSLQLERIGDYIDNGTICHEIIDQRTLDGFQHKFQKVADALGVPMVLDRSFVLPDDDPEFPQGDPP